ncbi:hypothetical protein G6F68_008451 [Rhizopus microsporus]|nr:hypothetical protein G6F69_004633 [Rhizopus microsporus]KAG1227279.1 hypothetical protein G6F67_008546 [Rhizopus microsporus]KAG1258950.1 hypothetical protein G6F68_008451 [Rhizopus microsporus]
MPPKKHRKPLTPLQRKQIKRKRELIHKATVKSQYYKELNQQKDDTPDYVKEVFGMQERTIDENGNVVELHKPEDEKEQGKRQNKPNPFKSRMEESLKRKRESEQERREKEEKLKEQKEQRHAYYKERSEKRRKMLSKTKRGQPKMAARMDVLLEKIEKQAS